MKYFSICLLVGCFAVSTNTASAQNLSELRKAYSQLEEQANRLAEQRAALATKATRTPGDAEALEENLANTVRQAFAARQKLQRAELDRLRQRLILVEQQLASRERVKDTIIQRRVEELINPRLRWEPKDGDPVAPGDDAGDNAAVTNPFALSIEEPKFPVIENAGFVEYDPSRMMKIRSRLPGRVELLHVDFEGSEVKEGDLLVELSSPELYTLQTEFLAARTNINDVDVLETTREVLRSYGLSKKQIDELERRGKPMSRLTVASPIDGVIIEKKVQDGEPVKDGTHLLTVVDPTRLHVKMYSPSSTIQHFHVGDTVTITFADGGQRSREAKIRFIDPRVEPVTNSVAVVAEISNEEGDLRPGTQVRVTLTLDDGKKEHASSAPVRTEDPYRTELQAGRSSLILRSAEEFGSKLDAAGAKLTHQIKLQEKGYATAASVEALRRQQMIVRDEYDAQIRLLELELKEGELAAASAKELYSKSLQAKDELSGVVLAERKLEAETASIRVERAKTLLELYRNVAEPVLPILETVDEESPGAESESAVELIWEVLGVKLRPISRDDMSVDQFRGGMQISEIRQNGPAAKATLKVDDIIVGLHRWETISLDNVAFVLNHSELKDDSTAPVDVKVIAARGSELLTTTVPIVGRER